MQEPIWQPSTPEKSRMWQFMRFAEEKTGLRFPQYETLYQWSIQQPAEFWSTLAAFFNLSLNNPSVNILNHYEHMINARWFEGASLNFAEHLLQRQDDHPALIAINEAGAREVISFYELRRQVARCTQALKQIGIKAGDHIAAIMPNTPHTLIAMLASSSLGAVWSSCSTEFGVQAALDRLGQTEPTVLFAANSYQYAGRSHDCFEKIRDLQSAIPSLKQVVICPIIDTKVDYSSIPQTTTWEHFTDNSVDTLSFTPLPFAHPLYIMFSSGTTGKPKCIIHGAGGTLLQHLKELALHSDLDENSNLLFYSTCGWMMWNWMASALALGTTLTLYEGSPTYPKADRLFKVLEKEKVTAFGTSAKFISSIEKAQVKPIDQFDLSHLKIILSTGSPLLPSNYDFIYQQVKPDVQLSSISGGTDIISCFALGNPLLPVYRGELQCFGLGMAVAVFNEQGQSIIKQRGELVCTKAFPSMPIGFWHDEDRKKYKKAYFERFPGIWAHGDFAAITAHHGLIIYGRSDAVLNPGGVRIGTAEIYRQIENIPEILDSVVIGQNWQDDVRVVLFVKLREQTELSETLKDHIKTTIRQNASPRHVPAKILQVPDIPRTMSGKTVELAVKQTVENQPIVNLESLANPQALAYFKNREELL